jgi:hypothetical protein
MSRARIRLSAFVTAAIVPLSLALAVVLEEGRRW